MPGNPALNLMFSASPLVLIQEPGATFIAHVSQSLSTELDKWEFELRITSYELRSKKFRGHSPASMELFDEQWRAVRLAELTIRNS